jgi:membrane protein DedA with SNARE-associated domain
MDSTLLAQLTALGPFALLLLMGVAFAETGLLAGFLLPGDTLMVGAGLLVATGALRLPLSLSLLAVTLAAMAGDQLAYVLGRHLGHRLLDRPGSRLFTARRVDEARAFVERHGPRAVILARFVPVVRTLTPVVAGMGLMGRRRFMVYNTIGAAGWAVAMLGGGYWFGAIPIVANHLDVIMVTALLVSLAPAVVALVRRHGATRTVDSERLPLVEPGALGSPVHAG